MSISSRYSVQFEPIGRCAVVKNGTSLLDAALLAGIHLASNCRGQGDCGECAVEVISGKISNLTDIVENYISEGELLDGQRLACCVRIFSSVEVQIPGRNEKGDLSLSHDSED